MSKIFFTAFFFTFSFVTAICQNDNQKELKPSEGKSLICIVPNDRYYPSIDIIFDSRFLCNIEGGHFICLQVDPGTHSIDSRNAPIRGQIILNCQGNAIYYVKFGWWRDDFGGVHVRLYNIDEAQAQRLMKDSKRQF